MGGQAVANTDSVSDWDGAQRLVQAAIDAFGGLHVLVNNAGILRDRVTVNMNEAEWDAVITVHLKGHFCPTHWAAAHWRDEVKQGREVKAAIVNTSSASGLFGNFGQLNYSAAKAGIAAMTIVEAMELGRYGVRSNCIAPVARTRLTLASPGFEEMMRPPDAPGMFDALDPANVSPLVAYLATQDCPFTGGVFHIAGNEIALFEGWRPLVPIRTEGRWTIARLAVESKVLLEGRPPIASSGADLATLLGGVGS